MRTSVNVCVYAYICPCVCVLCVCMYLCVWVHTRVSACGMYVIHTPVLHVGNFVEFDE